MANEFGNPVGQPLKYKSKSALRKAVVKYFNKCEEEKRPPTLSGLALALKVDRKTILNYSKRDKYFPTIQNAKLICEAYAEEQLFRGSGPVAGVMFSLKNNFDSWKEKSEVKVSGLKQLLDEIHEGKQPIVNPESGSPQRDNNGGAASGESEGQEVENKQSVLD